MWALFTSFSNTFLHFDLFLLVRANIQMYYHQMTTGSTHSQSNITFKPNISYLDSGLCFHFSRGVVISSFIGSYWGLWCSILFILKQEYPTSLISASTVADDLCLLSLCSRRFLSRFIGVYHLLNTVKICSIRFTVIALDQDCAHIQSDNQSN